MPLWLATAKAPNLNAFLSGEENVKLAEMAISTRQADAHFQATDLPKEFRYKLGISGKTPLRAERVNEVTLKITNGDTTNVPTAHGERR